MNGNDSLLELENMHFRNGVQGLRNEIDRRIFGNDKLGAMISSVSAFDHIMAGTEEHQAVEAEIRGSVPSQVYVDTPGQYLYGCFYPQTDVSAECTPSFINGFKGSQLMTCNFPVLEIDDKGAIIKHNQFTGERAYLFTKDGTVSAENMAALLDKYGISRVDIFAREGETIKYNFIKTTDLDNGEDGGDCDGDGDDGHTEPPSKTQNKNIWIAIFIIAAILLAAGVGYWWWRKRDAGDKQMNEVGV